MAEHRRRSPSTDQVRAEWASGGYATRCICGHLWPCPVVPPHPEKIHPLTMLPVVGGELDDLVAPLAVRMAVNAGGKLRTMPYELDQVVVEVSGRTRVQPYWRFTG